MKQRFSSLDVKVIARELAGSLINLRVSNIYDLSSRIFLLKFAKPGTKEQLLVDSGFRCHLTNFGRTTLGAPSVFVTKLRKHLKSRRVTAVSQVGTDRVIQLEFSDGQYRLFLEFFAAGNLVLTDKDYNILLLLRNVSEGRDEVDVRPGVPYPIQAKQQYGGLKPIDEQLVRDSLQARFDQSVSSAATAPKKTKKKNVDEARRVLATAFPQYPLHLLEHIFHQTPLDPVLTCAEALQDPRVFSKLMNVLTESDKIFKQLASKETSTGFIIAKTKGVQPEDGSSEHHPDPKAPPRDRLLYEDFHPFRPSQFEGKEGVLILEIEGFNKTADEFYSSIETQKLESRLTEREDAASRKIATAREVHDKRIGALKVVQEVHIQKAEAIEANSYRVEEAIAAVNGLIGQGMDWMDIAKLIENEQQRDNEVAQTIKLPLKLYENTVTLLLGGVDEADEDREYDTDDTDDSEAETLGKAAPQIQKLAIDIDLSLTSWANARQYYDQKKSAAVKESKTLQASAKALKSAERKITADLRQGLKQEKDVLRPSRKPFWFEKFWYFISSDGYLVIGGKDPIQDELLYRRYLKKGDMCVHADLQGASSVIVKNHPDSPDAPIPPSTLSQAGSLAVCTSTAWDSKAVMSAWWVTAEQVSKTAPTGEYLASGGVVVKGEKNFLPPAQLIFGFAVGFLISEESKANHNKHRVQEANVSGEDKGGISEVDDLTLVDGDGGDEGEDESDSEASEHNDGEEEAPKDKMKDGEGLSAREDIKPPKNDQNPQTPVEDDQPPNTDTINETANHTSSSNTESESEAEAPPPTTNPLQSAQPKTQASRSRPKTKAQKRLQAKYLSQDPSERALAATLQGQTPSNTQIADSAALAAEKAAKLAKAEIEKQRRKEQLARRVEEERKREARLAAGTGEVGEDGSERKAQIEEEEAQLRNLDTLVPEALSGDVLLAAVPIAAPWAALGKYRYKVKMVPGGLKKGKAVREVVGAWTIKKAGGKGGEAQGEGAGAGGEKGVREREVDCIRAWRVEEVLGCLPVGKVRIVAGAGGGKGSTGGGKGGTGGGAQGKGNSKTNEKGKAKGKAGGGKGGKKK